MNLLGDRPAWSMNGSETLSSLDAIDAEIARLETSRLHYIARIDETGHAEELGARNTAELLTFRYRIDPRKAHGMARLARALSKYTAVLDALPDPSIAVPVPDGTDDTLPPEVLLRPEQAAVIVSMLEKVPTTVPTEPLRVAEEQLVRLGRLLPPAKLSQAAQRARDLLDQNGPEPDEQKAYARERLTLIPDEHGVRITGYLANDNAELMCATIHTGARPHRTIDGERDPRSAEKRRADALSGTLRVAAAATDAGDIRTTPTTPPSTPTATPNTPPSASTSPPATPSTSTPALNSTPTPQRNSTTPTTRNAATNKTNADTAAGMATDAHTDAATTAIVNADVAVTAGASASPGGMASVDADADADADAGADAGGIAGVVTGTGVTGSVQPGTGVGTDTGGAVGVDADTGGAVGVDADTGGAVGVDADTGGAVGVDADAGGAGANVGAGAGVHIGADLDVRSDDGEAEVELEAISSAELSVGRGADVLFDAEAGGGAAVQAERCATDVATATLGPVVANNGVPGFGAKATLVVTIDWQDLKNATAHAIGNTVYGSGLSASTARLLACDAKIIPVVLGSNSEPLDVGRCERLVTKGMRRALNTRDRGCVVCGAPPVQCDAHHLVSWIEGGVTAVHNLVLLCRIHHVDLHAGKWLITIVDGKVRVALPTWADPPSIRRRVPSPDPSLTAARPIAAACAHRASGLGADAPGPSMPSAGTPGRSGTHASRPAADRTAAGWPGVDELSVSGSAAGRSGVDRSVADWPGVDELGMSGSAAGRSGVGRSVADWPGVDELGMTGSGTSKPGAGWPSVDPPDADRPDVDERGMSGPRQREAGRSGRGVSEACTKGLGAVEFGADGRSLGEVVKDGRGVGEVGGGGGGGLVLTATDVRAATMRAIWGEDLLPEPPRRLMRLSERADFDPWGEGDTGTAALPPCGPR
ncbi:hypothetical protein GCM10009745_22780 [Kribbella yunnanensis]|uniref:HNH nuclease domain-containing protein n=1 Tax=Kribbella yunnanensis TaxID=190194 RepID=A0ABP4SWX1_9ACTN